MAIILGRRAGGGGGSSTAAGVSYDNGASGLTADDVQEAVDELAAGGTGTHQVIYDEVLAGSAANFDVTNIPQDGIHLRGVGLIRGDANFFAYSASIRLNGDSGANMYVTDGNTNLDNMPLLNMLGGASGTPASSFCAVVFEIPHYTSAVARKIVMAESAQYPLTGGGSADFRHTAPAGQYLSTDPVDQITVLPNPAVGGNFVAGSRLTIYKY